MIIIISSPGNLPDEAAIINELFDAGLELFHLRKPDDTKDEMQGLLRKIKPEHYSKIILHQHHSFAVEFGINRIHFTEMKRKEMALEELNTTAIGNVLSTSIHYINDYEDLSTLFEYTFYGPVFTSISKKDYASVVEDGLSLGGIKNKVNIIAIGGIKEDNINKVLDMGFDGVALLGAIWQVPEDAIRNYKKIKNKCRIAVQ